MKRFHSVLPAAQGGLILAAAIPLCHFLGDLFDVPLRVGVNLWEVPGSGMGLSFPFPLSRLVRIVMMAVVLNLVFWAVFRSLLRRADVGPMARLALEMGAVFVILCGAAGTVFHWGFDQANAFYVQSHGYDASAANVYLFFGDEWLGHHLQHLALFGYVLVLVAVESKLAGRSRMDLPDILLAIPTALVVAAANGYAAFLSESAVLIFVPTVVLLGVEIFLIATRRLDLRRSPILLASLAANIAVIAQHLAFAGIYGLSPWYPFLRHG